MTVELKTKPVELDGQVTASDLKQAPRAFILPIHYLHTNVDHQLIFSGVAIIALEIQCH